MLGSQVVGHEVGSKKNSQEACCQGPSREEGGAEEGKSSSLHTRAYLTCEAGRGTPLGQVEFLRQTLRKKKAFYAWPALGHASVFSRQRFAVSEYRANLGKADSLQMTVARH